MNAPQPSSADLKVSATGVIIDGPAPLGNFEVELRPGLTALYGRNGAGKTRLLQEIRKTLSGAAGSWHQWHQPFVTVEPESPEELVEAIRNAHTERKLDRPEWIEDFDDDPVLFEERPWHASGFSELEQTLGDVVLERWFGRFTNLRDTVADWTGPAWEDVVVEVVRNHRFVASPGWTGPWNLDLAVALGPATPKINLLRNRLLRWWGSTLQQIEAHETYDDDLVFDRTFFEEQSRQLDRRDFLTMFGAASGAASEGWHEPDWFEDVSFPDLAAAFRVLGRSVGTLVLTSPVERDSLVPRAVRAGPLKLARTDGDLLVQPDADGATIKRLDNSFRTASVTDLDYGFEEGYASRIQSNPNSRISASSELSERCDAVSDAVNRLFSQMLAEAPTLNIELASPEYWFANPPLRWKAIDVSGASVLIDDLSGAQQRLARLAISLVITASISGIPPDQWGSHPRGQRGAVFLLDEPEVGIHATAQAQLVRALDDFGREQNVQIFAATHSQAFLGDPHVNLIEVYRDNRGATQIRGIEFPANANPDALGVNRADLLQLYELVLLVEGRHDELVLKEVIGEELARRRALIVPLRGAANLKALVDLQILTDTLEVPVVVVLDGSRQERVDALWQTLAALAADAPPNEIDDAIARAFGDGSSDEERQVAALARRLLEREQLERFHVVGLGEADILDYLPVERLVPAAESWTALRSEHVRERDSQPKKTPKEFKRWLELAHNADFSDDAIRIAASVTALPDEFPLLLARIDSVLSNWTR